jgi:tetratricopeptide (TPR) repeat protein
VLALAGCAQFQLEAEKPKQQPVPQVTEDALRDRAKSQLAQGIEQYIAGDYEAAIRSLNSSLEHGMLGKVDQSRARKYLAFSHCVQGREPACRAEFRKAFEINADFALTPAEDGHPLWGPVYRDMRNQLIAEREASEQRKSMLSAPPQRKAEQMLLDGMVKYDVGDYPAALKLLEGATREGLKEKPDRVRALKLEAFCLCLMERYRDCRATFIRIYDFEPDFDLTPAEAGHPSWTKTFAGAKAQAKKALQEKAAKEAREKASKDKAAAPPAAAVPKKN